MFHHHLYSAATLFSAQESTADAGMPRFANLRFVTNDVIDPMMLRGAGLYFIQHHQVVIYLGQFLGTNDRGPFSGNILSARWKRHISTLSVRGTKISISTAIQHAFKRTNYNHELAEGIASAHPSTLAKDKGFQVAANRFAFAVRWWPTLRNGYDSWARDFTFGYVRLDPDDWTHVPDETIWKAISTAEKSAIGRWRPQANGGHHSANVATVCSTGVFESLEQILRNSLDPAAHFLSPAPRSGDVQTDTNLAGAASSVVSAAEADFVEFRSKRLDEPVDAFWENLPEGAPTELSERLRVALENDDDIEIHYTRTNDGDLRLRLLNRPGGRKKRNCFTMYWQQRCQRFFCRAMVAAAEVVRHNSIEDVTTCHSREPLWCEFKLNPEHLNSGDEIIEIIREAIANGRNGLQDPRL